jgi:glycosyltransferase involved in cell wall biosynthesis
MPEDDPARTRRSFVLYNPNSELTRFHDRSPWLMLPRSFQGLGFESTLVCAKYSAESLPGIRVLETSLIVSDPRKGGRIRSVAEPFFAFPRILKQRPNLVIISPIRSSLIAFLPLTWLYRKFPKRLRGNQTAFVLKADSSLDYAFMSRLEARITNLLLVLSSVILDAVSIETTCGIARARGLRHIHTEKLVCIPLGFPQGRMHGSTYGGHVRQHVILCVARIARMKGQDVLLKAFATLAPQFPDWSVRLIGPVDDPDYKSELVDFGAGSGLSGRVSYLGMVGESELELEYTRAAIFCLPSVFGENAGQVKYEATAYGLPVVTTDVPCATDARAMGWKVARAGSVAELAAQLGGLMEDERARAVASEYAQSLQRSYLDIASRFLSAAAGTG